jgi:hypothetical protein
MHPCLKSGPAHSILSQVRRAFRIDRPRAGQSRPSPRSTAQLGASGVDLPDERDAFLVVAVAKGARHSTDGFQFAFEPLAPIAGILWPDLQPVEASAQREWLDALHPVESFAGFVDLRRVGMIVSGGMGWGSVTGAAVGSSSSNRRCVSPGVPYFFLIGVTRKPESSTALIAASCFSTAASRLRRAAFSARATASFCRSVSDGLFFSSSWRRFRGRSLSLTGLCGMGAPVTFQVVPAFVRTALRPRAAHSLDADQTAPPSVCIMGRAMGQLSQLQRNILAVLEERRDWMRPRDILAALGREPTSSNRTSMSKALDRLWARKLVEGGRGGITNVGSSWLYRPPGCPEQSARDNDQFSQVE